MRVRCELTYGVVVVDGDEATLGTMEAPTSGMGRDVVTKLAHLSANIASRTRRGGQSAARYSRNRDGEELAFLRKVMETTSEALGDVRGLVLAGRADMKRKLLAEFPMPLRSRVVRIVDLQCSAGDEGLRKAAAHLRGIAEADKQQEREAAVTRFMELVAQTDMHAASLVCYGEVETTAALRLGAVDQLLVASAPAEHSGCSRREWVVLAAASGASIVEVEPKSEAGVRFCGGFGVGARLRYVLDPALLEEAGSEHERPAPAPEKALAAPAMEDDADRESVSTAASQADSVLLGWLRRTLQATMQDKLAVDSLVMCAEVVLSDESTPAQERVESALEMLRGEGAPEDVLLEFACHATDHLGAESA
mmetsp:Transcript_49960/g.149220  ORF Transcript_49960/g.149220 Transcript_49960/m.149220 type:complete len:365 (-) Transcript_49960:304-1398(-)